MSTGGLIQLSENALTHEVLVRTAISWHPITAMLDHIFFLERPRLHWCVSLPFGIWNV
jgi:hypothetical protein